MISARNFFDGAVKEPILENDPANIAYLLGGSYYSYWTMRGKNPAQLSSLLKEFDVVITTVDAVDIDLSLRIIKHCPVPVIGYSEGHIWDYQRLSAARQLEFSEAVNSVALNLIYWEKYVPFYRMLSNRPVEYVPCPYPLTYATGFAADIEDRRAVAVVPTGLSGGTRNGLVDAVIARRLLAEGWAEKVVFCPDAEHFGADVGAISSFMLGERAPEVTLPRGLRLRSALLALPIDPRPLLRLRASWQRRRGGHDGAPIVRVVQQIEFLRRGSWGLYLAHIASAKIMIDLNNRATVGRNALDCAALGIPCVSTADSDLQHRLFPATTVEHAWALDDALAVCRRLLTDDSFYREVVECAKERVVEYGEERFKATFNTMLEKHRLLPSV